MPMRLRSALLMAIARLWWSWPAFGRSTQLAAATAAPAATVATRRAAAATTRGDGASRRRSDSAELQEIVVTGMRASLEKSLQIKRDATVVLDSINAEELGRFPDADVADSLEHLPGITITAPRAVRAST